MNYLDYRKLMIQKIAKKGIHKIDFLKRRTDESANNQICNKETI